MDEITYLDGTCGNVAVVRQTSGKWRAIVEGVGLLSLSSPILLVERVNFFPVLKYFFFLLRKVRSFGDYNW
jgi:hypothetical protein